MFRDITGTATFNLLAKGLEVSARRHRVIANNIANVNTPRFKRQIITFEEEMAKVFDGKVELVGKRLDDRHIPIEQVNYMDVQPTTITDRAHVMRNDKNNVDIDVEMSDLAKNTMTYQVHSARLAAMFEGLNDVITRGGRV
ncbi:MAG: Flagellar basal-body rod protein FlgB [Candidatus Ozemobacter sibiricus]|jgi:flagellar basal-body rod protein FlgB|uniref:Flagellar basal body rod protein FlgB n=1 Tax=Candidatus Ozemobacter sibiricus TaxID=2268124 RepID=A0A367ZPT6_9BACT|nr:MAG: Flagellar basal-body rod protein FlgB [Candidatus Ozemobacter sibiricus]